MSRTPRHDIQGLRALAVVLVVIFHLFPRAIPGGYVGVDVFFVISGFLITGHLLREVERTGSVRLSEFWARRVRRLLPAAMLVLAVSAVAVLTLLPAAAREQNLFDILFSALYVENWRLASSSTDYMAASEAPSIVQHYWSLSVEEQFYLVWPILIIAAAALAARLRRSPRATIAVALALVFVASLLASVIETQRAPEASYFMTTTRAWEFALGGLVALLPALRIGRVTYALVSWLALGVILASALVFDADSAVPGWIALIPVTATAALLAVDDSLDVWTPQYLARSGPVQFLGDNSYSIYLWHWPLIVIATYELGRHPGWKGSVVILLATIALGWATRVWVEDPIRRAPGALRRRRPTFVAMAVAIALTAALALVPVHVQRAQAERFETDLAALVADAESCFGAHAVTGGCDPDDVPDMVNPAYTESDSARDEIVGHPECDEVDVSGRYEWTCDFEGGSPRTVVYGDSHALHYMSALTAIADDEGFALGLRARTGCWRGFPPSEANGLDQELADCQTWANATLASIATDESIERVIIAVNSNVHPAGDAARAEQFMRDLRERGVAVATVRTVPGTKGEWPLEDAVEKAPVCVESGRSCSWTPPTEPDWLARAAASAGASIIDTWDVVCDGDGTCPAVVGGTIVYRDDNHVAATFVRTMTPWLREELARVAG